jgi:hypothetical protein
MVRKTKRRILPFFFGLSITFVSGCGAESTYHGAGLFEGSGSPIVYDTAAPGAQIALFGGSRAPNDTIHAAVLSGNSLINDHVVYSGAAIDPLSANSGLLAFDRHHIVLAAESGRLMFISDAGEKTGDGPCDGPGVIDPTGERFACFWSATPNDPSSQDYSETLEVFNMATGAVIAHGETWSTRSTLLQWKEDGILALTSNGQVSTIDPATGAITQKWSGVVVDASEASISPNGRFIAYTQGTEDDSQILASGQLPSHQVLLAQPRGSVQILASNPDADFASPVVSNDGSVAFVQTPILPGSSDSADSTISGSTLGENGNIMFWKNGHTKKGRQVEAEAPLWFGPDGQILVSGLQLISQSGGTTNIVGAPAPSDGESQFVMGLLPQT